MVGIIGFGKMGEAIGKALINKGFKVATHDPSPERRKLAESMGIEVATSNAHVAESSELLIIAVKPQVFREVAGSMRGAVADTGVAVSVMAGVSSQTLKEALGIDRVVRVMPNTPALVGEGAVAVSFCGDFSPEERKKVFEVLEGLGEVFEVPEGYMDAITGLSGSGPAYIFLFIEALSDAGVKVGLPRDLATRLSIQTVKGSVKLLTETGASCRELLEAVTSPGGTTIHGLHELEKSGFKGIVMEAVEAATRRSRELGG